MTTLPKALRSTVRWPRSITRQPDLLYLKAMNTVSAFCASAPKTLPRNNDATVVPLFWISAFEAALERYFGDGHAKRWTGDLRKVRHISQNIEQRANAQSKRPGNLQSMYGIPDVVHDIVDVRPTGICEQHFESGGGVLQTDEYRVYPRRFARRTSLLLCELPAKALRKLI